MTGAFAACSLSHNNRAREGQLVYQIVMELSVSAIVSNTVIWMLTLLRLTANNS